MTAHSSSGQRKISRNNTALAFWNGVCVVVCAFCDKDCADCSTEKRSSQKNVRRLGWRLKTLPNPIHRWAVHFRCVSRLVLKEMYLRSIFFEVVVVVVEPLLSCLWIYPKCCIVNFFSFWFSSQNWKSVHECFIVNCYHFMVEPIADEVMVKWAVTD